MRKYTVRVVEKNTSKIEKEWSGISSLRMAEKLKRGMEINLNHKEFKVDLDYYDVER